MMTGVDGTGGGDGSGGRGLGVVGDALIPESDSIGDKGLLKSRALFLCENILGGGSTARNALEYPRDSGANSTDSLETTEFVFGRNESRGER